MLAALRLDRPGKVALSKVDTKQDGGLTREEADARLEKVSGELAGLQELLYAAGTHGLLVVLQGRDTSGKDGVLKVVAGAMHPVGIHIASFKTPTPLELSHDFLWRVHAQAPGKGQVTFFNRSHYEDVLVVRVHNLVPETAWRKRYARINDFEELLSDSGVIVVKFCLHISKEEQEERLLAREEAPEKAWKLNPGDWEERQYWDAYTDAYEEALERCAAPHAPWFVIPSDRKWFRNLAVAEALADTLRPFEKTWQARLAEIGVTRKAALSRMRQARG